MISNNGLSETEARAHVAAVKPDYEKKVEKLLSERKLGTHNTTVLSYVGQTVTTIVRYVAKQNTSAKTKERGLPAYTDAHYVEILEGLVQRLPALNPSALDSVQELYNALKYKVEETLKRLIPIVQSLQEESMVRSLETMDGAGVKEAKAKSSRLLLDELSKLTNFDEDWLVFYIECIEHSNDVMKRSSRHRECGRDTQLQAQQ